MTAQASTDADDMAAYFAERAEADDPWAGDYHGKVIADYARTIDPVLMKNGWSFDSAKSLKYGKYDQSMLAHTRSYVTALVRLNRLAPEDMQADEDELRRMVAMGVVHDLHKQLGGDDEFNISVDLAAEVARDLGLFEFAPGLTERDVHSAVVGMHKMAGYKGKLTDRFLDAKDALRVADACASIVEPDGFRGEHTRKLIRDAYLDTSYTTHTHSFDGIGGALAPILNGAVHDVLTEQEEYDLFEVYEMGCTYLDRRDEENEVETLTDDVGEFIDNLYDRFRERLRGSYTDYRNDKILAEGVNLVSGQGYYEIDDLDIYCLSQEDLIRATLRRGIRDSANPFELSDRAKRGIEHMEDLSGMELNKTNRIEGVARAVHTIRREIAPHLVTEDGTKIEKSPLTIMLSIFDVEEDMQRTIVDAWQNDDETAPAAKQAANEWPYKYLFAQHILDRFFDGAEEEKIAIQLADHVNTHLNEYCSEWETFREDLVGDIDEEVRALLAKSVTVDGYSVLDNADAFTLFESFMGKEQTKCGLCDRKTTASNGSGGNLRLLNGETPDVDILVDGKERTLVGMARANPICYACQLDISLRSGHDNWADDDAFYAKPLPDYSYSPVSQVVFDLTLDRYTSVAAEQGNDFTDAIFDPENIGWYEDELDELLASPTGVDMLTNLENAFNVDNAFGSMGVRYPLPDRERGDRDQLVMGVFTAATAATYAGFRVALSRRPQFATGPSDQKAMLELVHGFDAVEDVFGRELPLDDMHERLKTVAAVKQLTAAMGKPETPLTTYHQVARGSLLPGTAALAEARTVGSISPSNGEQAAHLDKQAAATDAFADAVRRATLQLATPLVAMFPEASTRERVQFATRTFNVLDAAVGENLSPSAAYDEVRGACEAGSEFHAHEYARTLVDVVYADVCNGQRQTFKSMIPVLADRVATATLLREASEGVDR